MITEIVNIFWIKNIKLYNKSIKKFELFIFLKIQLYFELKNSTKIMSWMLLVY